MVAFDLGLEGCRADKRGQFRRGSVCQGLETSEWCGWQRLCPREEILAGSGLERQLCLSMACVLCEWLLLSVTFLTLPLQYHRFSGHLSSATLHCLLLRWKRKLRPLFLRDRQGVG